MKFLKPRTRKQRILRLISLIGFTGWAMLDIRYAVGNLSPTIVVPPKPAPAGNSFDSCLTAVKLLGPIRNRLARPYATVPKEQWPTLLSSHRTSLDLVSNSFSQPYMDTTPRGLYPDIAYQDGFRYLVRLMEMDAELKADRGEYGAATDRYLDEMEFGCMCARGSGVQGMLLASSFQSKGRQQLWPLIDHLNAGQAEVAIHRMQRIVDRREPIWESLTDEKYSGEATLDQLFRNQVLIPAIHNNDGASGNDHDFDIRPYYLYHSKRWILDQYLHTMDYLISDSHRPYRLQAKPPSAPYDMILVMMDCTYFVDNARITNEGELQNQLLLTALALHAFKCENGAYPTSLQALVPRYLNSLPTDAFAIDSPLEYKRKGAAYVLYSIGPDGVDNGGVPIVHFNVRPNASASNRYYVSGVSSGDIVAGVNIY